jgi:TRAP-type mannitol/chloroaromatic compound transport system permease small subunit
VRALLKASGVIDAVNDMFGVIATWLVLLACLISAGNAGVRYGLNAFLKVHQMFPLVPGLENFIVAYGNNANAFLETQWYMFAGMVLLGAAYTLKVNEHVRVDLVFGMVSDRTRILIDIFGIIFFLAPMCLVLIYFTWPWFLESFRNGEVSSNAGGLIRWPVKLVLPVGFALMLLQGLSELIKRVAALQHHYALQYQYEKPLQ